MNILLCHLLAVLQVCDFTLKTQLMGVSETSAKNMDGPADCQRSKVVTDNKSIIHCVLLLAKCASI